MTASGYIARTTGRTGEPRIITSAHPTREDAARAAFEADPKARSCTTCRARHGRETHADIQQHSRWSVTPAPAPKEGTTHA